MASNKTPNSFANEPGEVDDPPPPPYNISVKRIEDTQKAAELYRSGKKLWLASDLERIEHELSQYRTRPSFTIRRTDGSITSVKNPLCGISQPIWKPYVEFQHYWHMLRKYSNDEWPWDILPCYSYFIRWRDTTFNDFVVTEQVPLGAKFEECKRFWERSSTCDWLKRKLALLRGRRKITKLICFGLGDMNLSSEYDARGNQDSNKKLQDQKSCINQHVAALTIATTLGSAASSQVEIFVQDPRYTHADEAIFRDVGITIVGEHCAGGFGKVDDDCAVFFRFPAAPVRQIIADIARPAIIIGNNKVHILNKDRSFPFPCDADSPRTREMFEEYQCHDLTVQEPEMEDLIGLNYLNIYVRDAVVKETCKDEKE
ncbi:hypothetical protein F4819DRAFT_185429 [Hypoxylon fuscum]|nr:hypothetical protein F4819DRAFT_185429 [Hypoxylon fuscum]